MPEHVQIWNLLADETESRFRISTCDVNIAAETTHTLDLQRVIQLQILIKPRALRLAERIGDQLADGAWIQRFIIEGNKRATDPCAGGRPSAEV